MDCLINEWLPLKLFDPINFLFIKKVINPINGSLNFSDRIVLFFFLKCPQGASYQIEIVSHLQHNLDWLRIQVFKFLFVVEKRSYSAIRLDSKALLYAYLLLLNRFLYWLRGLYNLLFHRFLLILLRFRLLACCRYHFPLDRENYLCLVLYILVSKSLAMVKSFA